MARKRQGTIYESADQLAELASRHNGRQQESRIRMLLLLQQDSSRTVVQAADMIHCSERTVRRWWKIYQEEGLDSLLSGNDLPAPETPGMSALRMSAWNNQDPLVSGQMADFLNALPVKSDTAAWIEQFRTALRALLGDVDTITVNINLHADAEAAELARFHVVGHDGGTASIAEARRNQPRSATPGKDLVSSMEAQGFPVEKYQPPHIIDYHTEEGVYVGSIILWREEWKREISLRTIRTLSQLRPFLMFALSDCAARRKQAETSPSVGDRGGLVIRDREPVFHQLPRKQYQEVVAGRYPGASAA
jgi:hypothetical protein